MAFPKSTRRPSVSNPEPAYELERLHPEKIAETAIGRMTQTMQLGRIARKFKRTEASEETRTTLPPDEHIALNGVLSASRHLLVLWHRGLLEGCGDEVQTALVDIDEAVGTWRDSVQKK